VPEAFAQVPRTSDDTQVNRPRSPSRLLVSGLTALVLGGAAAACGDDPFQITWISTPDTTVIYSLARPELGLPSAFDFLDRDRFVVEAPGSTDAWDVALDTRDGRLALVPPGALGVVSEARITVIADVSFDDVLEAPADTTLYTATDPVFLALGNVYVVRTRLQSSSFGVCMFYAKLEPLVIDTELESVHFVFDNNPRCEDRNLQPDQERS
jgi:hypothetical protein